MALFRSDKSAFTLIELSIVLVIIGLLAGGVLIGRDLIVAAQVRAQVSQVKDIETAIFSFKGKYGSYPGDMPDAIQYFGAADSKGFYFANGNGDEIVASTVSGGGSITQCGQGGGAEAGGTTPNEVEEVFHQLNAAGMGTFDIYNSAYSAAHPGFTTFPYDKLGGNIIVTCLNGMGGLAANFQAGSSIVFGWKDASPNTRIVYITTYASNDVISPALAKAIDTKADDGLPLTGNIGSIGTCLNWPTSLATYDSMASTCNVNLGSKLLK